MSPNPSKFTSTFLADDGGADERRTALLLHSVHPDDRDWLLAQLSEPQRRLLRALLNELKELGIQPDASMLGELGHQFDAPKVTNCTTSSAVATPPVSISPEDRLLRCSARDLAIQLRDEPDYLVALLVSASDDWPWVEELLRLLGAGRRASVLAMLSQIRSGHQGPMGSPSLRRELLRRLAQSIADATRLEDDRTDTSIRSVDKTESFAKSRVGGHWARLTAPLRLRVSLRGKGTIHD